MSGPKTGNYAVSSEIRRRLQRERQARIQKAAAELMLKNEVKGLKQKLRAIALKFDLPQKTANELWGGELAANVHEMKSEIAVVLEKNDMNALTSAIKKAEQLSTRLKTAGEKNALRLETKVKALEHTRQFNAQIESDINKGFGTSFKAEAKTEIIETVETTEKTESESTVKIPESPSVLKESDIAPIRNMLAQIKITPNFADELIDEIQSAQRLLETADAPEFLRGYKVITAAPLIKKCKRFTEEYETFGAEFNSELAKYQAVCEACGVRAEYQNFAFSAENLRALKKETARLDIRLREADEQAYISQTINNIMREMGYQVLGEREVTKKSGKKFVNKLYSPDGSKGTAVKATLASDGAVAMELVGLSEGDRQPTAAEASRLCGDMREFCADYNEITRKLEERGIVTRDINKLPPDVEYAKIENITPYNLENDVNTLSVKPAAIQAVNESRRELP